MQACDCYPGSQLPNYEEKSTGKNRSLCEKIIFKQRKVVGTTACFLEVISSKNL